MVSIIGLELDVSSSIAVSKLTFGDADSMIGGGDGRIWSLILEERTRIVRVVGWLILLQFLPLSPLVTMN